MPIKPGFASINVVVFFARALCPIRHAFCSINSTGDCNANIHNPPAILDGIDVILSPGHSVGGQSVIVNTSGGRSIITGFCCNDKNFPPTGPAVAPGVHIDLTEAYDSIQKISQMADILIPLHDLSIGKMERIP